MKLILKSNKDSVKCPTASERGEAVSNHLITGNGIEASAYFNMRVTILYVEDNVINQTLARKMLTNIGCNCEIASSGAEAFHLLERKKYDLILMDINMPVLDGLETTRHIRQNLQLSIPVIAVTTNVMDEDVQNCMNAGMNDHVGKPYSQQQLSAVILKWCKITGVNY
jgi:two-component system, sensor histidine kinase SagS